MKSKKTSLRKFFRSHFPKQVVPSFILFENMKTHCFDIVSRSGFVVCSVPPLPFEPYEQRKALAQEVFSLISGGDFSDDWFLFSLSRLDECFRHDSARFDYSDCYPCAEYAYHPDDFFPISIKAFKRELKRK